jgi:predicted nucleic acid-binding protein
VIAACAIRNGLAVLHRDRDFDVLGRVSPLESRTV